MKSLLLISCMFLRSFTTATTDYKTTFGSDYTRAIQWLQVNQYAVNRYAEQFHIPVKELKAIVFPELIRYNSVYDAIEINSLKFLYVSEGSDYADFSIGYFQMKPSFAEMVEQDAGKLNDAGFLKQSGFDSLRNLTDNENTRRQRLNRLGRTEQQMIYLCAFYKICEARFAGNTFLNASDRVKFFATCYNAGYRRSYEKIMAIQQKNYFHMGKIMVSADYNYADISAYYFKNEY